MLTAVNLAPADLVNPPGGLSEGLAEVFKLAVLGVVQGLTEFLPISSSGHLGLGRMLLGVESGGGATVEVVLHIGTLLSVLVYLRRDLRNLVRGLFLPGKEDREASYRTIGSLLCATVPVAIVGLTFRDSLESLFQSGYVIGAGLLVSAGVLFVSRLATVTDGSKRDVPGPMRSFIVGVSQIFALIPGISRSGTTIVVGQFLGLSPEAAGRFSFLMAIPVIAGAVIVKSGDIFELPSRDLGALGAGVLTSFVSGLIALKLLSRVLKRRRLFAFAYYLVPLGLFAFWVAARG